MGKSLRIAYGEALRELGAKDEKIIVMDADLAHATMTHIFEEAYPERFYNMGIAEANLVCTASGFAHSGLKPFVSTFALFGAGRAFEQIRNSVCYSHANVKFALSHSGLCVGEDGGSHQSIEDIALMRTLPGMTILVPCDPIETKKAVNAATQIDGPVYIRVARPVVEDITDENTPFVPGKANILKEGKDLCIMATGLMVSEALKASKELEKQGINAAVVNIHTIKPIDTESILLMAKLCKAILTVEEHSIIGGLGSAVADVLIGQGDVKFRKIGVEDKFGKSGKPEQLFEEYGLTTKNIVNKANELVNEK